MCSADTVLVGVGTMGPAMEHVMGESPSYGSVSATRWAQSDVPQELGASLDTVLAATLWFLPGLYSAVAYLYRNGRLEFGASLRADGSRNHNLGEPRQNGLTYTAALTGELVSVVNVADHPGFVNHTHPWDGALAAIPLKTNRDVVGVMTVVHREPHVFLKDELRVLGLLADQLAMAIQNARLAALARRESAERERQLLRQKLLAQIAIDFQRLDFTSAMTATLTAMGEHLGVSRVQVYENDATHTFSRCMFEWCRVGYEPQQRHLQHVMYRDNLTGVRLLREAGIVCAADIGTLPADVTATLAPLGLKAVLLLPLHVQGRFSGFIGFDECERYRSWEDAEVELCRAVAGLVSTAYARRASERELRGSEERFRALAENSPDAIMRFDRAHRHLYVNPSAGLMTGIPSAQFVGKTHRELGFPEDLIEQWEAAINQVFESGNPQRVEFCLPTGVWIDWLLFPELTPQGDVSAVLTSARDITQRKKVEDQTHEALIALAQVDRLRRGFVAYASHELRTPLTNLTTSVYLLEHGRADKRSSYLTTIQREVRTLRDLIDDLTAVASLDVKTSALHLKPVTAKDLLAGVMAKRVEQLIAREVRLEVREPSADLPALYADASLLSLALDNLVIDAAERCPRGAVVSVCADFGVLDGHNGVAITIRPCTESAAGVPAGLRLTVCQEIVERHQGTLTDTGSAVTAWLPIVE